MRVRSLESRILGARPSESMSPGLALLNGEMLTHETLSAKIPANAGYVDVVVSKSLTRVISAMSTSGDGVYIRQVSAINAKNIRIYTDSNIRDRNTFFLVLYL